MGALQAYRSPPSRDGASVKPLEMYQALIRRRSPLMPSPAR